VIRNPKSGSDALLVRNEKGSMKPEASAIENIS
jgi:hypothetical protein